MIVEQNMEISHLLKHAEVTDELGASLMFYTPSQHRSVYPWSRFATRFLTVVHDMVGVILFIYSYIRGLSTAALLLRTLEMGVKSTTVC